MSNYRRYYLEGQMMVFFTVVTDERRPLFEDEMARMALHTAISEIRDRFPFSLDAIVLLPDHLHAIWTMPSGDNNFSTRWRRIKEEFTRTFLEEGGTEGHRSASRLIRGERAVWQRRFHEHVLRDELDFERHLDYLHYNPVKHGIGHTRHFADGWSWASTRLTGRAIQLCRRALMRWMQASWSEDVGCVERSETHRGVSEALKHPTCCDCFLDTSKPGTCVVRLATLDTPYGEGKFNEQCA